MLPMARLTAMGGTLPVGEAKRRGTYEQRVAQAAKAAEERAERNRMAGLEARIRANQRRIEVRAEQEREYQQALRDKALLQERLDKMLGEGHGVKTVVMPPADEVDPPRGESKVLIVDDPLPSVTERRGSRFGRGAVLGVALDALLGPVPPKK